MVLLVEAIGSFVVASAQRTLYLEQMEHYLNTFLLRFLPSSETGFSSRIIKSLTTVIRLTRMSVRVNRMQTVS